MNELIQELIKQAQDDGDAFYYYHPLFAKRLAELVVRECCNIADEVERADMDSYVSKYIRARFGVE